MSPVQPNVPEHFAREQGYGLADWERTLSGALAPHRVHLREPGRTVVALLPGGSVSIAWQVLEPRRIALVRLPRLQVEFRFDQVDADHRARFMRAFDLYTQRGGG